MSVVLTDLSAPSLARAIKANLLDFFRYLHRAAQTDFYAGDRFARWHTRVPHPWFNGVIARQPPAAEDRRFVEETLTYFRRWGVSTFTWWLEPDLPLASWQSTLMPYGFHVDCNTPGMAVDLQALHEDVPAPPALKIVPVEDEAALKVWTRTFVLGYELPAAWEHDFYDLMAGLGLDLPVRNYLGRVDGEPVATANLFLAAGVAGIQCVATVPHARGRGFGAALTLAPLCDARAMGYRAGILQSSEMGFRVYRRLGFQQLCNVDHFYWTLKANEV
jgi:GNAT superfamily N-acetyltransferase